MTRVETHTNTLDALNMFSLMSIFLLGPRVEVAVVATALPVLLSVSPKPVFNFGQCTVDEQMDALCTLNNDSENLPASFSIHKIAHFHTQPKQGSIKPGKSADFVLSFQPNQIGQFKPILRVDVLGNVVQDFSSEAFDPTATRQVLVFVEFSRMYCKILTWLGA